MADDFALSDLPGHSVDRPAEDRGSLTIHDRVLEKLARRASSDVSGTVRHTSGLASSALAGSGLRNTSLANSSLASLGGRRYPSASISVLGERAWVEVDVAGLWPCDLGDLGARTHDAVSQNLRDLGGVEIERLDVTVHVVSPHEAPESRVQ